MNRHPEVRAASGEPRRMTKRGWCGPSFETRARIRAPQDEVGMCGHAPRSVALLNDPVVHNKRATGDQACSRNRFAYHFFEFVVTEGVAADTAQHVLLAIIGAQDDTHMIALGLRSNPCPRNDSRYSLFFPG